MQWERKMDCVDETGRRAKYLGNIMGQEVWAWAASGAGLPQWPGPFRSLYYFPVAAVTKLHKLVA